MPRYFNTAGPNDPRRHYTLPVLRRLPQLRDLIDKALYFVLHAPRQIGKTTTLLGLARELTAEGKYAGVLVSVEVGAAFPEDIDTAEPAILQGWTDSARAMLPPDLRPPSWSDLPMGNRLGAALARWTEAIPRPLVVFLDEIDALQDNLLISVLRQLRSGYPQHPDHFPWSLALIGLRDVRDYKVASGSQGRLGTASPFNIKAESLTLRNFTRDEVQELYEQHTAETGQVFSREAIDSAFEQTYGQPWLVNALARQMTEVLVKDRSLPIEASHVDEAREILIHRQDTHLDSLAERLREPRVRNVLEPMLAGDYPSSEIPEDDRRFLIDLGLLRISATGGLVVANPIYREIIVRNLVNSPRASLPQIPTAWLTPEGRLDREALLRSFLDFWRRHGQPLLATAPYHEIAPHLVLMAFLHRVVNGGRIEREYAIGSGRMDLWLSYAGETLAIEIKVWRPNRPDPVKEGLEQIDAYLAGLHLETGWLVIFDRRPDQPPIEERTSSEERVTASGRKVNVIRG